MTISTETKDTVLTPSPAPVQQAAKRPSRRPWRQYGLPRALQGTQRVDYRKALGRALLAFRKGIVDQLGGGDLTASQIERLDAACAVKARLLQADQAAATEPLTPQAYACLVRELDRLLGSLERSATPERRHEKLPQPQRPDLDALLAADDDDE